MALAGLGLDYSRMTRAEQELQAGLDAALFAAAASGGTSAAMQHTVRDFIEANFDTKNIELTTQIDTHAIRVEARHALPLPLLSAVGIPQTTIAARGELTSRSPIRESGTPARLSQRQSSDIRRAFERQTAGLSPRRREKLRANMRKYLESAQTQPARFYLSE